MKEYLFSFSALCLAIISFAFSNYSKYATGQPAINAIIGF
jgi:hypothetical protein